MIWMASEWNRRKRGFNAVGQIVYNENPEGKDLAGLVCLSARQSLGPGTTGIRVPAAQCFATSQKMRELPICFFYGAEDNAGKSFSTYVYDKILNADKLKLKLTFKIEIPGTKLVGHELLGKKALGTEELVVKYLSEKVREARAAKAWGERDVPAEGRPPLNPLQQVPLTGLGVAYP
jgi:hypothetical protein